MLQVPAEQLPVSPAYELTFDEVGGSRVHGSVRSPAALRVVNGGGSRLAWDTVSRPMSQIERMFGAAAGTDGLHDALDVPVAVASLDVDAAAGVVRGEQHRRLPAATFPAEEHALGRIHAAWQRGLPSLSHTVW